MQTKIMSALFAAAFAMPVTAAPLFFSTGNVDGRMAMASRPSSAGFVETEAADDFTLSSASVLTNGTFTGLIPTGSSVTRVTVEIYRVFPFDSTDPPSGNVPTCVTLPPTLCFKTELPDRA